LSVLSSNCGQNWHYFKMFEIENIAALNFG